MWSPPIPSPFVRNLKIPGFCSEISASYGHSATFPTACYRTDTRSTAQTVLLQILGKCIEVSRA